MPYVLEQDRKLWILEVGHGQASGVPAAAFATALAAYNAFALEVPFDVLLFRSVSGFVITYALCLFLLVLLQRAVMERLTDAYQHQQEDERNRGHEAFEKAVSEAFSNDTKEAAAESDAE